MRRVVEPGERALHCRQGVLLGDSEVSDGTAAQSPSWPDEVVIRRDGDGTTVTGDDGQLVVAQRLDAEVVTRPGDEAPGAQKVSDLCRYAVVDEEAQAVRRRRRSSLSAAVTSASFNPG